MIFALALTQQASAETLLQCFGYRLSLAATISHYIDINGLHADVDGARYDVHEAAAAITLDNPIRDGQPDTNAPVRIEINRVDGRYFMMFAGQPGQAGDWSRPQDQGCKAVTPKF